VDRFARGSTNVVYETQWVTNLNGLELPLSATRKEFGHTPLVILGGEAMGRPARRAPTIPRPRGRGLGGVGPAGDAGKEEVERKDAGH